VTQTIEPDDFPLLIHYPHSRSTCVVSRPEQIQPDREFLVLGTQIRELPDPEHEEEDEECPSRKS
jgi:hypothetical protein